MASRGAFSALDETFGCAGTVMPATTARLHRGSCNATPGCDMVTDSFLMLGTLKESK